jgi:RNA polymerase-binding transcription factor DksA
MDRATPLAPVLLFDRVMNLSTLEQFRRNLIARRTTLLQRWRQSLADEKELLAEHEVDWQDAATALAAAAVLESIGERERRALARIQSSLARIEHGTYDECAICHGPIDEERLRVLPDTDRCVACAPALN